MITVKDVIQQLKYSELSGMNLGNNVSVGVHENNYNEIIANINTALLEIQAKLPSSLGVVYVTLDTNINLYHLNKAYLDTNDKSEELVKYLSVPEGQLFKNNVVNIVDIAPHDNQKSILDVNKATTPNSIWVRSNALIEVPDPTMWDKLRVTYNYEVSLLDSDYENDQGVIQQEVEITQTQLRVMVKFIVYKMLAARPHLDPQNNRYAKRTEFYNSVQETINNESVIDNSNENVPIFTQNGFI